MPTGYLRSGSISMGFNGAKIQKIRVGRNVKRYFSQAHAATMPDPLTPAHRLPYPTLRLSPCAGLLRWRVSGTRAASGLRGYTTQRHLQRRPLTRRSRCFQRRNRSRCFPCYLNSSSIVTFEVKMSEYLLVFRGAALTRVRWKVLAGFSSASVEMRSASFSA